MGEMQGRQYRAMRAGDEPVSRAGEKQRWESVGNMSRDKEGLADGAGVELRWSDDQQGRSGVVLELNCLAESGWWQAG